MSFRLLLVLFFVAPQHKNEIYLYCSFESFKRFCLLEKCQQTKAQMLTVQCVSLMAVFLLEHFSCSLNTKGHVVAQLCIELCALI